MKNEHEKETSLDGTPTDPKSIEVEELDEKSLKGVAGGAENGEISPVDDINQLQCYC